MSTVMPNNNAANHPCVVHVGFSGSRNLWPAMLCQKHIETARIDLVNQLAQQLRDLKSKVGLNDGHILVGVAQMAVGADMVFADACEAAGIPLRVFLPQTRDEFLSAIGSKGSPDFDEVEREQTLALLSAANVIQERVVSQSPIRSTRFEEANVEILRVADVAVTLQAADVGAGKIGGASDFARMAVRHGRPLLQLTLAVEATDSIALDADFTGVTGYRPPGFPKALLGLEISSTNIVQAVKDQASEVAKGHKERFERNMRIVIWTHVGATAFAGAAVVLGAVGLYALVAGLLVVEVLLLTLGLYTHRKLHHDKTTRHWSEARLIAEIARSAETLGPGTDKVAGADTEFAGQHSDLAHLFAVPLPTSFAALARTLNVVHLQRTRSERMTRWEPLRDRYVRERLDTETPLNRGQIPYFKREWREAEASVTRATRWFYALALAAIAATSLKLLGPTLCIDSKAVMSLLSWLAIMLPVAAVGVMSVTANLDKEARASNYADNLSFLQDQRELLVKAESEPEFLRLQTEIEAKLLGETVNWYYRRQFMNPS